MEEEKVVELIKLDKKNGNI